jgi:hypothetical protein
MDDAVWPPLADRHLQRGQHQFGPQMAGQTTRPAAGSPLFPVSGRSRHRQSSPRLPTLCSSIPLGTLRPGSGWCPDSTAAAANSAKGGISKQGDRYLRRLLVLGATAVIRHSRSKSTAEAGWLKRLLERRPARLVSVAQANKTARIVWALLVHREAYRMPTALPSGVA